MIDSPRPFDANGQMNQHEVRRLNELLRLAEAGASLFGGDEDSEGFNGPHGQSLSRQIVIPRLESWWGMLLNKGPKAEADYTNSRYWVRRIYPDQSQHTSTTILYTIAPKRDTTMDGARWITATNIDEVQRESHMLTVLDPDVEKNPGDGSVPTKDLTAAVYVKVYCIPGMVKDGSSVKPYYQYLFSKSPPPFLRMKLTNATLISGRSNAWVYSGTEQIPGQDGFWTDKPSGKTSAKIFNMIEANNSATGIQGCGINVDNLPVGFALRPVGGTACAGHPVVKCYPDVDCKGVGIYYFEDVNLADGECGE